MSGAWDSRNDIDLEFDLRLHLTENEKQTKLYRACVEGSKIDIDECLLEGKDVNEYNINGCTPLHGAVLVGAHHAEDIIDMLLNNGADINKVTIGDENTALHLAVERHPFEKAFPLVIKLVNCHADKTIRNRKLRTAYDICLAREFNKIARFLDGEEQVTTDEANSDYMDAMGAIYGPKLVDAVMNSHYGNIKKCLENHANTNVLNKHGAGAIHYAVTHCTLPKTEILQMLVDHGANVNLPDYEGDTPLNLTIKNKQIRDSGEMSEIVINLLNWGADIHCQDLDGNDALELAQIREYQDIVHVLRGYRSSNSPRKPGVDPGKYGQASAFKGYVSPTTLTHDEPPGPSPKTTPRSAPNKPSPRKTPMPPRAIITDEDDENSKQLKDLPKQQSPRKPEEPLTARSTGRSENEESTTERPTDEPAVTENTNDEALKDKDTTKDPKQKKPKQKKSSTCAVQ